MYITQKPIFWCRTNTSQYISTRTTEEEVRVPLEYLKGTLPLSMVDEATMEMIKNAEMIMQNALLLQQQVYQLEAENQYRRKRKGRAKQFI